MKNNYYIYLATFDSLLKVGISYEYRLLERLVEQGADFGANVLLKKDGKSARSLEKKIKTFLNAKDRIRRKEKHATLFGNPNHAVAKLYEAIGKLKDAFNINDPEIFDLRGYYKLQNVLSEPTIIDVKDRFEIKGKVVAAKGNILIFRNHDKFFSIDTNSLIGRDIKKIT